MFGCQVGPNGDFPGPRAITFRASQGLCRQFRKAPNATPNGIRASNRGTMAFAPVINAAARDAVFDLSGSAYRGIEQAASSDPAPLRTLLGNPQAPTFPGEPPLLPSRRYPLAPFTPEPSGPRGGLLDKERPTIDGEANPHIGVRVPIRRDTQGSTDTLRLDRHIETRSTFSDPDRNSYHRGSLPFLIYPLLH